MIKQIHHPVLGSVRQVGSMIRLSESPFQVRNWCLRFGQHTEEILHEIGYNARSINSLRKSGVIG
jgi:crotonobetainyl-CoA:carnitine CoA-transferase CaiB-like acyl-CoA transferase